MQYALEIARTGSISQAARNLYMNQPNLSKAVKELEQVLGITLFMRSSKGVIPTPEGRVFLESALDITDRVCQIREKLTDRKERNRTFNISIPRASYIAYAFTQFISLIPEKEDIHMNYQETNSMAAMENLLHHGFDLGIIRYPLIFEKDFMDSLRKKELCSRELLEFEHTLLMSQHHPLASKETIMLNDLENYTELVHGDIYVPFIPKRAYNRTNPSGEKNRRIYLYERGSQFDLLRNVPGTYMWGSPVPPATRENYQLVHRRCSGNATRYKDVIVYRSEYHFTPYAKKFLHTLFQITRSMQKDFN